ncbi:hypothetical protein I3F58_28105 [Streptomyces sp. MUM 203J]|uniref:hypothetical protein n=1 Tax=Streptomyces sp. MUM 203J TaxID=2791990 RepID=UPI001F042F26|nr:hypothetical protein [Streptomyces sp. MUM 203J]MCH0543343.1 hypothetical protein [Streptomyces sp. MUM 203J]
MAHRTRAGARAAGLTAGGAALLLAFATGCALDLNTDAPDEGPATGVRAAPLARPGTVSVLFCQESESRGGPSRYRIVLRSYGSDDGTLVAERRTALPREFEPTAGCGNGVENQPVAHALSEDLALVAGRLKAPSRFLRAAAVDTATGQEAGPPHKGRVGRQAQPDRVVFHPETGELWYGGAGFVHHRDPGRGTDSEQQVPDPEIRRDLLQDPATAATILRLTGSRTPLTPGGAVVATYNTAQGLGLARVTGAEGDGAGRYRESFETAGLGGMRDPFPCDPVVWRDDTRLLCSDFRQVTFSAAHDRVVKTEELAGGGGNMPANRNLVPSPDGTGFAFLSRGEDDGRWALYRADFTPGGQPQKITDIAPPDRGDDSAFVTSLVRWN